MLEELGFEVTLDQSYEQAIETVTAALKAQGFGVLTSIDVRATLKEKLGEDFRPYVILGACNPPLAHRALSQAPEVGLMLPCNVTVEEVQPGQARVRLANPVVMLQAVNLAGDTTRQAALQSVAEEARQRIQKVAEALR